MLRLERAVDGNTKILRLLLRKFGEFDADFFQVQPCDFFVEFLRQDVNADFVTLSIFPEIELREHLIGK